LHAQLDAMNAIAYTNESKKPAGPHAHSVATITSGGRSAKRFEKSNPGAAYAPEQLISPLTTLNRWPKAA
jgi:hypothetical protein